MSQTAQIIQLHDQLRERRPRVKADTEDGWFKVSNVLGRAECCLDLGKYEQRIYNTVKVKTYGYRKSFDYISGSQYEEQTGILPDGSRRKGVPAKKAKEIEKRLIERKILKQEGKKVAVNTIVSEWIYEPLITKKSSKASSNTASINTPTENKITPIAGKNTPTEGKKYPHSGVHNKKDNNNKIITKDIVSTDVVTPLKKTPSDYSDEFIWLWENRPKRQGSDSKKKAFQCCKARLKQGSTWRQMAEGMNRYKNFCQATGKLNTEFTMQMTRFFGSEEQFKEEWSYEAATTNQSVFTNQPRKLSTVDRQHASAAEYLARLNSEQGGQEIDDSVVVAYE